MAIVQVSRITHRKGLTENLPQLAGAELGWAIDSRRLFIGNGTLQEGAPQIGNTEILTEFSDILGGATSYVYKGQAAGYTAQTGPGSTDITRTLQSKLDDFASVRDFGAVGDGETDDSEAINRALYQLFCREVNTEIRRSLFFPAGTYKISETILIPPYAKLYGEGPDSSIIQLSVSGDLSTLSQYCARTSDSLQQTGVNIGNNGATAPTNIEIDSMSFACADATDADVFLLDRCSNVSINNVKFNGSLVQADLSTASANLACVRCDSTTALPLQHVTFDSCQFSNATYGFICDNLAEGVSISGSKFDVMYRAISLGEAPIDGGPGGCRIMYNQFDSIAYEGIVIGAVELNATGFNVFYDVANNFNGLGNPVAPVIDIQNQNNLSISDMFERDDTDAATYPRVDLNNTASVAFQNAEELQLGTFHREVGRQSTLTDNTVSPTAIFTVSSAATKAFRMQYTITRDTSVRHGTLTVVAQDSDDSSLTLSYSEEYDENASTGITFSATQSGTTISVRYTSTSTGIDGTLKYSLLRLA